MQLIGKIRPRLLKALNNLDYLKGLIISTPRYKLIILLSLLSGTFNFFGLPMLIPVLEYMQKSEIVGVQNGLMPIIDKAFAFFGIEPGFYSILATASILFISGQVLTMVTTLVALYSTNTLIKKYSKDIFRSYINVDWLWLTGAHSGEINYVVLDEVRLAAAAHLNAQRVVIAFIQCLFYFLLAIRLSAVSVVLALCIYVMLLLLNLENSRHIRSLNEIFNNLSKELSKALAGLQQNKKFLKTSLLNSSFIQKIFYALDNITKSVNYAGTRMHLQTGWNVIATFLFLILLIIFRNQLGLGYSSLLVLLIVFNRIAPQFDVLSISYSAFNADIPMHLSVRRRLRDMENNMERNGTEAYDGEGEISFDTVSFTYPNGKRATDNLNLKIPPYKISALVGSSGGGKSTILDLMLGLLKPDSGTIYYGDIPHFKLDLNSLRSKVAYVSQQTTLLDGTLKENLTIGYPEANQEMIKDICKKIHIAQFIEQLPEGLNTRIGENGIKLSGGQRQRVVLGRSLFMNPKILILDEATSELDSETEAMIQETIKEFREGLTIIIVAHRLSTVKLADLIYVIEDGKICESGSYEELLEQRGRLYQLDSLQRKDK